ncbi:MAG: hypothetical protein U9N84_03870 [Actinomycetota bacterium]|nr:hypothetical protein [Actinomycetota bacterium]
MEVTPALVLAMWTAGMAGGGALVSHWAIVGPGFGWLTSAVVVVVGGATAMADGTVVGLIAAVLALGAGLAARHHRIATVLFAAAALGYLVVAIPDGGVAASISGAVFLGGMTTEMLLGHWFLVDPRLPRRALQRLDLVAAAGLVADVAVLAALGALAAGDVVMLGAMGAVTLMTGLLIAGVWFSLKEPSYSGVMAATGLSYLGVLTAFGVVVVGRLLVAGL